jgi:3-deoxy-D-manno-octulosonic-acid transferase
MKLRAFLILWAGLWHIGLPLILLYLWRRGRKDALYARHLAERFGRYGTPLPGAVWVHAVSLGEMRSAVPLIRAFLDQGDRVVTTHFTPAGRREAERVFAPDIAAGRMRAVWVPLEMSWAFAEFFRAFRPRFGLVMEIEIWPCMIFAARAAGVPLFMCNAQYPSKSLARDTARFPLRQALMRGFAGALVKSDLQRDRFASIGVTNIAVTGEFRFEQPIPAQMVRAGRTARDWLGASGTRVIAIASTVEGEEPVYLHAIRALIDHHARHDLPAPLFIYIPRRPERFDAVAEVITASGLDLQRRSALFASLDPGIWGTAPPLPQVILGDSLGEMYFYLAMADQVIVGGGFNRNGAHNIIEPLAMGLPVITGPQTDTIEYPMTEAVAAGVARTVPDAAGLADTLITNAYVPPEAISRFFANHSGAVPRTLAALPGLLARARS